MATYNLKSTITLDVGGFEDFNLQQALENLKKDLETRFPLNYTNIVVVTEQQ